MISGVAGERECAEKIEGTLWEIGEGGKGRRLVALLDWLG